LCFLSAGTRALHAAAIAVHLDSVAPRRERKEQKSKGPAHCRQQIAEDSRFVNYEGVRFSLVRRLDECTFRTLMAGEEAYGVASGLEVEMWDSGGDAGAWLVPGH
jgi:hypothetical protein